MTRILAPSLSVLVLALSLQGCSTKSSSTLATNQIKADYSVVVEALPGKESTYIGVIFNTTSDDFTHVQLDNGDTVSASTDKDPMLALPYDSTLQVYSSLQEKVADRTRVTIALNRAAGAAPASTVALPPAVALTAPADMAPVPYANGTGTTTFTWSNAVQGGTVHIVAFPSCDANAGQLTSLDTTGPDTGSLVVSTSKLIVSAPPAGGQCILVRIDRAVNGTLDPALAGGSTFLADRYDYAKVVLMP